MCNYNCKCKVDCLGLAVLSSVVIGIIAGFLTSTGLLTLPTMLLAALGVTALISLGLLLVLTASGSARVLRCICDAINLLLTGILGTILTTAIFLFIDIAVMSVVGSIISGFMFLFFSLLVTVTACIIRCIAHCEE